MISNHTEALADKFLFEQGIKIDIHIEDKHGMPDLIDTNGNRYEVKVITKKRLVTFTSHQIDHFKNNDFLLIYENDRKTLCLITKFGIIKKDICKSGYYCLSKKRLRRLRNVRLPM